MIEKRSLRVAPEASQDAFSASGLGKHAAARTTSTTGNVVCNEAVSQEVMK